MSCWMWSRWSDGVWRCTTPGCNCLRPRGNGQQELELKDPTEDEKRIGLIVENLKGQLDTLKEQRT